MSAAAVIIGLRRLPARGLQYPRRPSRKRAVYEMRCDRARLSQACQLLRPGSARDISVNDEERRIVVDSGFEAVVGEASRAIDEEGLRVIASIDQTRLGLDQGCRYVVLEAWSPELQLEALRLGVDTRSLLLTTFAIYELAGGQTVVLATEPFSLESNCRQESRALAALADRESERVARMLERLQRVARRHTCGRLTE